MKDFNISGATSDGRSILRLMAAGYSITAAEHTQVVPREFIKVLVCSYVKDLIVKTICG